MELITQILLFFGNNTPIISFVGAIIGGEETLIFLSVLAAQGYLTIWFVFIFFYLGVMTSDILWYFIGKSKISDWIIQKKFISSTYLYWGKLLNTTTGGSNFQALLFTKFLYGLRMPAIIYIGREGMKIKPFLFYSIIVNFIWAIVITIIGWFAGKGISLATSLSNNLPLYLLLMGITLIVFVVLIRLLSNVIKKWMIKKQEQ